MYLPRLKTRDVLAQAIRTGAGSKDFYGTAYGQTGEAFEGFKFGDSSVQLDDTLLLIAAQAALDYETAHPPGPGPVAIPAPGPGPGTGSSVRPSPGPSPNPVPGPRPAPKARSFHGTAEVNASTAKMRLVQLAEEIISLLGSDPNATVKVTLEVDAEFPDGASDQIRRSVTENATSLGFRTKAWE